jgi:hypothetical protein
MHFSLFSVR